MQLSKEDCDKWINNKNINPITRRKIKQDGPVFKKIEAICIPESALKQKVPKQKDGLFTKEDCDAWNLDPSKNPITKRKLNMNAKNGIYTQLLKICKSFDNAQPSPYNATPKIKTPIDVIKSIKSPTIKSKAKEDDINTRRNNLIIALKNVVAPIIHKNDTSAIRINFLKIMTKYLKNVSSCIEICDDDKLCIKDKKGNTLIFFDRRIGSESVYGMAYLNLGVGFAKMLKFSCKVMKASVPGNKKEIEVLQAMSNLVINNISPNMPLIYKSMTCKKLCDNPECPAIIKNKSYFVVINELANYDLITWFKSSYPDHVYESIFMQILFAIYSFHTLGYSHNDCHLGNFLVHNITPGGCWRYKFGKHNVYVPNHGYQLVMWDPGLVSAMPRYNLNIFQIDYIRVLGLIYNITSYDTYKGAIAIPQLLLEICLDPLLFAIQITKTTEFYTMLNIIDKIKNKNIIFKSIVIDDTPPTHLINVKPYINASP